MNCIFFVLVDLSRTITAGVGLGLRTVRGASFCLIQLGHQTARARPFCLALNGMALLVTLRPGLSPHVCSSPPASNPRSWLCQHNIRAVPFILCRPRAGAGFLGSPFPPRSRPGWPSSGSGNSPVPWSKTWLDAGSTPRGAVRTYMISSRPLFSYR